MILHHIQTSPAQDNALATCLRYIDKQDTVLLSGNAVNALLLNTWQHELAQRRIFILEEDVKARGLTERLSQFNFINYEQFVQETLHHDKVISW
ncbi:sulfurtransferase TusB [Shewanella hanedai]|jgi:tRNA 2-thiouridine synthesizing protein B|uniref:Sulfurtransferase complex subunit TusB n=1 Tax=Shewanella hanedai TaxID=25 RepID=A0A553JRB0_SHEHA|nr:sulfurtransferase complex subunit TusB [Shewanella hanedai]TRY14990.1 sulfurtransferase complex subunit TusB [Shewanella hanedai]GGI75842.1 sulfurtransferase TusB [Shewanella hanedai]